MSVKDQAQIDPLHITRGPSGAAQFNRALRIGIVSPYSFETPGGVQNHIRDFALQLMDRGHQVSVFAPGRRTKDMPLWVQTTNSSFAVPYNGSWAHLSYFLAAGHETRRWVRQGHFDIVHLHEPEAPSLAHKPIMMKDAPPLVATFHASIEPYPRALKLFERYLNRCLEPIREAIFVSPAAQQTAEHYLPQQITRQTIPNGIDRHSFTDASSKGQWMATHERPTIGFLGRMGEERKGFRVFAAAAAQVLKQVPQARFLCAGDGEDEARRMVEELAKTDNIDAAQLLDHMEFLGRISDADKASFYHSLSCYVAPQTGGESFGIVLAEAMAAGCPIVASDLDAFVSVTEQGQDAQLFAVGQPDDCARAILQVLNDRRQGQQLSAAGLRRSKDFDWPTITDQVLEVYARALGHK
ncbi:glycosyltransferase family 4 protein [Bifidobacterium gallicum]|nr:glycosyltransferase family 4 protein [Bifidobacterium gallicum]EFA23076.1 glycosyltransferase, group 1 family protein [Bifidobacterium gallicum DSM 20093 = LMG 11596]